MQSEKLKEELSALLHDIWANWAQHMIEHWDNTHKIRWLRQIHTPYDQLSEGEKNSDREVAAKILALLEKLSSG